MLEPLSNKIAGLYKKSFFGAPPLAVSEYVF